MYEAMIKGTLYIKWTNPPKPLLQLMTPGGHRLVCLDLQLEGTGETVE
jgi:hypothetical protein